jgi:hypothetical protein
MLPGEQERIRAAFSAIAIVRSASETIGGKNNQCRSFVPQSGIRTPGEQSRGERQQAVDQRTPKLVGAP